eukprot:4512283-Alexandrium_andersonii.AAC.1
MRSSRRASLRRRASAQYCASRGVSSRPRMGRRLEQSAWAVALRESWPRRGATPFKVSHSGRAEAVRRLAEFFAHDAGVESR